MIKQLGRLAIDVWDDIAGSSHLFVQAMRAIGQVQWRVVIGYAFQLGNRSLFFVAWIMAFTGAIMTMQVAQQSQRIIGDLSLVGPAFLQLLVSEFGPTIVAMMVAARSGAGMAAEIGTMQITEQVDAIRMAGAEPPAYLVTPRLLGSVIGMVPLAILGSFVAFLGGGLALRHHYGLAWSSYFDASMVGASDVMLGLIKATAYGLVVPTVSCYMGLTAQGGAPGVGRATTRAVIGASAGVLFWDLLIGAVGYGILH